MNDRNSDFAPYATTETKRTEKVEVNEYVTAQIETTKWFNFGTTEPGQPGVFAVDPVPLNDQGDTMERFAYWNGRQFGPATNEPHTAYEHRFDKGNAFVTKFRGLSQQPA